MHKLILISNPARISIQSHCIK